jgi:putative tryptophan/tyrosine transport system substrate-binding protein
VIGAANAPGWSGSWGVATAASGLNLRPLLGRSGHTPLAGPDRLRCLFDLTIGLSHRLGDGNVVSSLDCMNDPQPEGRMASYIGRRKFLTTFGVAAAAWPLAARAQNKQARIGWFTVAPHPYIDGFRRGLRELGWIEGENLVIEHTYADGHPERLAGLATVLARVPYDVIVASGSDALEAARAAIQSTPIVGISSTLGIGGSLARSEGNLTGIALLFDEVANKWPELLVDLVPRVRHIGVLFDPSPSAIRQSEAVSATAAKLGKTLLPLRIDNVDTIRDALERARREA